MSIDTNSIEAAMDALKAEVAKLEAENARLGTIKATIRVNALRHGASDEQVERFLDGSESFVQWLVDTIKSETSN
ncbi:MAG: hypothetical protein EP341_11395 [Sphingomonadales bacterium]|nr:MAG: hypothetical protein EP341_11395 [Sphingomonadales bacterium]